MYIRHFWGFDLNLYIFNVNLGVNVLIVRACFGAQTCIHMKANTLNDIYFFGRMLYNEFLQNVHLVPKSNNKDASNSGMFIISNRIEIKPYMVLKS